jgi:hypothetical protein
VRNPESDPASDFAIPVAGNSLFPICPQTRSIIYIQIVTNGYLESTFSTINSISHHLPNVRSHSWRKPNVQSLPCGLAQPQIFFVGKYVLYSDLLSFLLHQCRHSCLQWLRHSSVPLLQQRMPKTRLGDPQSLLRVHPKEQLLYRSRYFLLLVCCLCRILSLE